MLRKAVIPSLIVLCIGFGFLALYFYTQIHHDPETVIMAKDGEAIDTSSTVIPDTTTWERLSYFVNALGDQPEMKHASWGFCMIDIENDSVVLEYDADRSLTPASVMKAVTTASAIGMLGPDYRLYTRLQYDGSINKARKTLNGNLYIKGGGDPTLGSPYYEYCNLPNTIAKWMKAVKALGIDTINGAIVGDARVFDNNMIPVGWAWEDMQTHYTAPICGLSFAENQYVVRGRLKNGAVYLTPQTRLPEHKLVNELVVDKSGGQSYVYVSGMPYVTQQLVKGGVSRDSMLFSLKPHIPDPAYYAAHQLYLALTRDTTFIVKDSSSTVRRLRIAHRYNQTERKTIQSLGSQAVRFIAGRTNRVSQNYYAETLLKTIALAKRGHGSTYGGSMQVREYLKSLGINTAGFIMADGSGLSRFNKITPRQLSSLLTAMSNDSTAFYPYFNSLAITGKVGTLRKLCKGKAADGKIHGKSGYMTLVRSYTGYVDARNGRRYAFCMMANNYNYTAVGMRDQFERIMNYMAELEE